MLLKFRQGIVSGTNFVLSTSQGLSIQASTSESFQVTIANGDQDLLYTVSADVTGAFNYALPVPQKTWLYLNVENDGELSYGYTIVEPITSSTPPSSPVMDLHWFDLSENKMKVYNSLTNSYTPVLRVFLATVQTSTISHYPAGVSQVGITSVYPAFNAGHVIFNKQGNPIFLSDGQFLTSSSELFIDGGLSFSSTLDGTINVAVAGENIGDNQVVKFDSYGDGIGIVSVADYTDLSNALIGYVQVGGVTGSRVSVILQGMVTNDSWTWENSGVNIGSKLFVGHNTQAGQLVPVDPQEQQPALTKQVPVARILSNNSVYFDQGLGGVGARGPAGTPGNQAPATTSTIGGVILSEEPSDPQLPVVASDTDPRLTDARTPLPHTHLGTDVDILAFGSEPQQNVQAWIENLFNDKIDSTDLSNLAVLKAGSTMTGFLTLVDAPTDDFHAATKKYVDDLVSSGGGLVNSVFGRTGNVAAASGDYSANQIDETGDGDVQTAIDNLRAFDSALGTAAQQNSTAFLQVSNNGSDIQDDASFRTNIGLGSSAVLNAGAANGVATLDSGGKVPLSQLPSSIAGGLNYIDTWDASTNTPTITSGVGNNGDYYVVNVAGTTEIDGISSWDVNDWIIFNGSVWQKIDNSIPGNVIVENDAISRLTNDVGYITAATAPVQSVAGKTGVVTLTKSDITDFNDADYATAAEGDLANTALQPTDIPTISLDEFHTTEYSYQSIGFTANVGQYYAIDVSSGGFTATLPATPSLEDTITFFLSSGDFTVNNLIIGRNGETIENLAEDMIVDTNYPREFKMYFNGTTWRVIA